MLAPRFALGHIVGVLLVVACAEAARHENVFSDVLLVDGQQVKVQVRAKRETTVKHKTQHLKPAIEIEPINEKVRVAMPHFNVQDVASYASQAAQAIATRFDEFEPQLLASNGEYISRFYRVNFVLYFTLAARPGLSPWLARFSLYGTRLVLCEARESWRKLEFSRSQRVALPMCPIVVSCGS